MKTENKFKIGILLVVILASSFSCQKFETITEENEAVVSGKVEATLESATVNPNFDWNTSRNITFNITSDKSQVILIRATDDNITYHKGMHLGNPLTYTIQVSVPSNISKLSVNQHEVSLSSDLISVDL